MRFRLLLLPLLLLFFQAGLASQAAVVVLTNRTAGNVRFTASFPGGRPQPYELASSEVLPVQVVGNLEVAFQANGQTRTFSLPAHSAYYFTTEEGKLKLVRVGLVGESPEVEPAFLDTPLDAEALAKLRQPVDIPVKILVDDEEPAVRARWEKQLRRRLEAASELFEYYCHVRFKVVAVETWDSDDSIRDFSQSLREFEREVDPKPARLAIGFSSQYQVPKGRFHLGGIRGPLVSHILIRNWSQHVGPSERVEILAHEMGHFLGAAHSGEMNSIMRPVVSMGRGRGGGYRIGFDPLNILVMNDYAEELRRKPSLRFGQISPEMADRLKRVYATMAKHYPEDDAAARFAQAMDRLRGRRTSLKMVHQERLVEPTRKVVQAITQAAQKNHALAKHDEKSSENGRMEGDRLLEYYFRRAAETAQTLPADVASKAYLLGLALALDKSGTLRKSPLLGPLCRQIETEDQRRRRLEVLGKPTMHQRRDLARHFVDSAVLALLVNSQTAETGSVVKEALGAQKGGDFSFADLAADLAGVAFADRLRGRKLAFCDLAETFAVEDFLSLPDDLPPNLSWSELNSQYSGKEDPRFLEQMEALRRQIRKLPGHQPPEKPAVSQAPLSEGPDNRR